MACLPLTPLFSVVVLIVILICSFLLLQVVCAQRSSPTSSSCSASVWDKSVSAWQVIGRSDWLRFLLPGRTFMDHNTFLFACWCVAACATYRGDTDATLTADKRTNETCQPHIRYGEHSKIQLQKGTAGPLHPPPHSRASAECKCCDWRLPALTS